MYTYLDSSGVTQMATRSTIAIENLDGTVHQVYCHWDGYIEWNGVLLNSYYNTREAVEKLISKGGISTLRPMVSDTPIDFDARDTDYTIFYSYRGEVTEIRHFKNVADYEKYHQYEDFEYIFTKDNVWSVFYRDDWYDLEELIQEKKIVNPFADQDSSPAAS
jgi:hypothetical protein